MQCCTQTNGLGQFDPVTIAALNEAFVHAKDLWDDILAIFGVGTGRQEADIIVPLQNQITDTVLAPVGAYLERVRTHQIAATCAECTAYNQQLLASEQKWLSYLHNTKWSDGRAAQQAEATLAPIYKSQKDELAACIKATCGGIIPGGGGPIPIITNPDGSLNWSVIAVGAGLAYALMRK